MAHAEVSSQLNSTLRICVCNRLTNQRDPEDPTRGRELRDRTGRSAVGRLERGASGMSKTSGDRKPRTYYDEFRHNAISLVEDQDGTNVQAARELGINQSLLWT